MNEYIMSEELREDKNLKLSNSDERSDGGFMTIIENSIKNNIIKSEGKFLALRSILEQSASGPNYYVLAALSERIYNEKTDSSGEYCHGETVLENYNWQLLTVAESGGLIGGYFGAAYWEPDNHHIIIAHCGTKDFDGVLTDLYGVLGNKHATQIDSAITFTNKIISVIKHINKQKGTNIQLFLTGHSLGGWLAPITAFSAKYFIKKDEKFIANKKFEKTGYHTKTVIFDPPGCEEMLRRIQSKVMDRYSPCSINCLDITTFLSAPNVINACNHQVGNVYRLVVDLSNFKETTSEKIIKEVYGTYVNCTRFTHRIDNIKKTFNPMSGEVLMDENGNLRIKKVIDWPLLVSSDDSPYLKDKNFSCIKYVVQYIFSRNKTKSCSGLEGELAEFFQLAKSSNNFLPNEKELVLKIGGRKIRYKNAEMNKNYMNECNLKVFNEAEREFLVLY